MHDTGIVKRIVTFDQSERFLDTPQGGVGPAFGSSNRQPVNVRRELIERVQLRSTTRQS